MLEAKLPDGWLRETCRLAAKQTMITEAVLHPCVEEELLDQLVAAIDARAARIAELEAEQKEHVHGT